MDPLLLAGVNEDTGKIGTREDSDICPVSLSLTKRCTNTQAAERSEKLAMYPARHLLSDGVSKSIFLCSELIISQARETIHSENPLQSTATLRPSGCSNVSSFARV